MTATDDTFAAFVNVLADALDDHESRGEELARRVHLSRFHLDRVISAAAGEPPSRLRRRVLARAGAAYRLVTTGNTVLDVALEAGYGSHEAFTRAFVRDYGISPVRWRRRPSRIQIAAPSGVHFHPPGSLRLPARVEVSSMDLLVKIVEHHVWLVGEYVDRAARLDDAQLDAPIEITVDDEPSTLRGLLSRLVGQMDMWLAAIETREYDFAIEEHEPVSGMRTRLDRVGPAFADQVREVAEQGRLDETFVDALCEPAHVFTYGGMIAHVVTFSAYRRTLVALALDHAGITDLGWGDPMHWVAETA